MKRHVVIDKNGFHMAVMITVANIHDSKVAMLLMLQLKSLGSSVKTIIAVDTEGNWLIILEIHLVMFYK